MISKALTRARATAADTAARPPRPTADATVHDLSIVIVSYNTRELLLQCLASIRSQETSLSYEVIVVDNHSSDGSAEAVRRDYPEVRLIESSSNVGFSVANNAAIDLATGRFVLLLNSDTFLVSDVLDRMVEKMREEPEVGIAGCRLIRPSGEMDLACRRSFPTPLVSLSRFLRLNRIFPKHRLCGRYNLTYLDEKGTYEVDSIVGAFMLVRREVIDRLGALDEDYFMYGEDVDWCYRIKDRGWKVLYVGDCVTYHHKGASSRKLGHRNRDLVRVSLVRLSPGINPPIRVKVVRLNTGGSVSQIKVVTELPVSTLDPWKRTAHGEHKTGGIL